MTQPINVATVFSGIGSFEYVLKKLNISHKTIFACDIDKYVKKSYFANYDIDENRWFDDVCKIDGKVFENKIDLFVGSSPCQSYSIAGNRLGLEDNKGTLFYEFTRLVKEIQPKVFIYENVKNLINHNNGKTFEIIKASFEELGYNVYYKVLNSKDFGIPQHRERIFVVGFKDKSVSFNFPTPTKLNFTMQDFLEDYPQSNLFPKTVVGEKYYISEKLTNYIMSEGTKNFKSTPKTDLLIARTLLQSMHKMHRAGVDNYVTHGGRLRKLTPTECLRLMGFGDDFKQVVSDTQLYRQSGNSVVTNVLENIFNQIQESLKWNI